MIITFSKNSWEDYTSWLTEDKHMLKKINELIRDIQRTPFEGKGKFTSQLSKSKKERKFVRI